MALVTTRATTIQGTAYQPGEAVDATSLDSTKVQQLITQRVFTDTAAVAPGRCVALRALRLGGREYQRGDRVDVRGLPPGKLSQMLEHRILDLAPFVTK